MVKGDVTTPNGMTEDGKEGWSVTTLNGITEDGKGARVGVGCLPS